MTNSAASDTGLEKPTTQGVRRQDAVVRRSQAANCRIAPPQRHSGGSSAQLDSELTAGEGALATILEVHKFLTCSKSLLLNEAALPDSCAAP